MLFESPVSVRALTIVMRSPMPWSYFGISDVSLLVDAAFPSMLVGSAPSAMGDEMCLVSSDGVVAMAPCLSAVAGGDGREIFQFSDGALMNAASKTCVTLANGDAVAGKMVMAACPEEVGDGRSVFELTSKGQLKLGVGNFCVVATPAGVSVQDCAEAEAGAAGKFFQAGVPEFDPSAALGVKYGAAMLKAAAERQSGLLTKLQAALPTLSGCNFAMLKSSAGRPAAFNSMRRGQAAHSSRIAAKGSALDAVAEIYPAFGVDRAAVAAVIADSSSALSAAMNKVAPA